MRLFLRRVEPFRRPEIEPEPVRRRLIRDDREGSFPRLDRRDQNVPSQLRASDRQPVTVIVNWPAAVGR